MVESGLTFHEYPFLKELGLAEENFGCYRNGEWVGDGPWFTSHNPYNNKPIAKIKMASVENYEECIKGM